MKILIAEDDKALNNGIALSLGEYEMEQAFSLAEAEKILDESFSLIILDVNFPDGNGIDFCKKVREKSHIPVIFLTANDMEVDIVNGLEAGGDDYITKPFSLAVLRARVGAVLRRREGTYSIDTDRTFTWQDFSFDFENMIFCRGNMQVELSKTEQKLLRLLVSNAGVTLSREKLIDRIWTDGAEFVEENALSVTMKRLREKLPGIPVKTVYGIGYVWEK